MSESLNVKYILRNWVYATKSNCLFHISLQHDGLNLWFNLNKFTVWNI